MATSKSALTFTVLSLAAAAFAGAALWLPRRRSGRAVSPPEEPSPSDEAAPAAKPTSMAMVPFSAAPAPLSAIAGPISFLRTATRQFVSATTAPTRADAPSAAAALTADVTQHVPALLCTSPTSCQEVTFWWQSICCFVFTSSVSLTGQIVYTCVILEISFSITGITVSVLSFIRGSGPSTLMSPAAGASGVLPSAPVAGLSSEGSGISDGFFSSAGSSSSMSRTTSGSSTDIEETDFSEACVRLSNTFYFIRFKLLASPVKPAPAVLRTASSAAPPIPQVDQAAQRAEAWREEKRRLKKSGWWWRKVGHKLRKEGWDI